MVFLDPAPIGAATGVAGLDLGVFDKAVLREVEENHRTRFDATVADDVFRFDVQNARLRGEDEKIVLGERPARGSESVAVQCGSGGDAVGECHRRRAVPRFHQGGMVFVEAAYVVSHVVFLAPGLRHQHQHRVGGIATCRHKKFEDIVERGGIGLAVVDKRQHRFEIFPEECRRQGLLACAELIEVAADGVDFAVVREHPERMGELPGRKGVRRVALMDEREGGGEIALGEVRIESLDLWSEQESFIDDGSRGEGADVSVFQPLLDHAAKYESSALVGSLDEQLPNARHGGSGRASDRIRINRNVSPGDCPGSAFLYYAFDHRLFAAAVEDHRNGIFPGRRQIPDMPAEKGVRNLHEHARSVAGFGIVSNGAPVHKAFQYGKSVRDDPMGGDVVEIGNESYSARIVFEFSPVHSQVPLFLHNVTPLRIHIANTVPTSCKSHICALIVQLMKQGGRGVTWSVKIFGLEGVLRTLARSLLMVMRTPSRKVRGGIKERKEQNEQLRPSGRHEKSCGAQDRCPVRT